MSYDVSERERRFHNERFLQETDPRSGLNKWYAAIRHGSERQNALVRQYAKNKEVLEFGCADGTLSFEMNLPFRCKTLTGIDISDVAIEKAKIKTTSLETNNTRFLTMNAEEMTFDDQSFDLIFGRGILHHLDLQKCFSGIERVLRSNGVAIFCEPMGHNPILNLYRNRTPDIRTPDEHPLRMADLTLARRYFSRVETMFYGLFTVASVFLDATVDGFLYRSSKALDDFILNLPVVRRYAWHCLIVCRKD
jgi:ubiquinone/menaquinone biosynthesis C-methylase UbiE